MGQLRGQAAPIKGPVETLSTGPRCISVYRTGSLQGGADEKSGVLGADYSCVWGQRDAWDHPVSGMGWTNPKSLIQGSGILEEVLIVTHFTDKQKKRGLNAHCSQGNEVKAKPGQL